MELVGVHPTCSLKKTYSSFEEAHHWNIQAKFYSVKVPTAMCINDNLYGVQDIRGSTSVDLSKGIVVCPLLSFLFLFLFFLSFCIFWWPQWLFLFLSFVLFGIF